MPKYPIPALGLLFAIRCMSAQPPVTIAEHILWERDFDELSAEDAVADRAGNLWIVSQVRGSDRLLGLGGMERSA